MAMVLCEECGNVVDDDWNPCEEHPITGELTCPNCMDDLEEDE